MCACGQSLVGRGIYEIIFPYVSAIKKVVSTSRAPKSTFDLAYRGLKGRICFSCFAFPLLLLRPNLFYSLLPLSCKCPNWRGMRGRRTVWRVIWGQGDRGNCLENRSCMGKYFRLGGVALYSAAVDHGSCN